MRGFRVWLATAWVASLTLAGCRVGFGEGIDENGCGDSCGVCVGDGCTDEPLAEGGSGSGSDFGSEPGEGELLPDPEICGDGVLQAADETCDDGNTRSGDGCDAQCQTESGWNCVGSSCGRALSVSQVSIDALTFQMGSPEAEEGRDPQETVHTVTLDRSFLIQNTEVTREQFAQVLGYRPRSEDTCGEQCPVSGVSWFDALTYVNALSAAEDYPACYALSDVICVDGNAVGTDALACMTETRGGIESATVELNGVSSVYDCEGYRLPTEAEWEAAARAGSLAATYNDVAPHQGELDGKGDCESPHETLDPIAWFCGNSQGQPRPVASVPGPSAANGHGLYDVLGNVAEWCWDRFEPYAGDTTNPETDGAGSLHVLRGGSGADSARDVRLASRGAAAPASRSARIGFRPVRTERLFPGPFTVLGVSGGADTTPDDELSDGSEATVTWTDSDGESSYRVAIVESDGITPRCSEVTLPANSTQHTFTGCALEPGGAYRVALSATRGNLTTLASNDRFAFGLPVATSCDGALVGGFCWYLGAQSAACSSTCSGRGGTNRDGALWAGSDAPSPENCNAVLTALQGMPGSTVDFGCSVGWGCGLRGDFTGGEFRNRCAEQATDPDIGTFLISRACACNE